MIGFLFFLVCCDLFVSRLSMWLELCIEEILGLVMMIVLLVKYMVRWVFFLMFVGEL